MRNFEDQPANELDAARRQLHTAVGERLQLDRENLDDDAPALASGVRISEDIWVTMRHEKDDSIVAEAIGVHCNELYEIAWHFQEPEIHSDGSIGADIRCIMMGVLITDDDHRVTYPVEGDTPIDSDMFSGLAEILEELA